MSAVTTPATRPYRVSLILSRGLLDYGTAQATDAADAVRLAHGLSRRPSRRHDGLHGSGYHVGNGWYDAAPVSADACEVCGATHEVTPGDRIGDRGEQVSDAEAMMVAHYRLSIAATSAAPFALHGGRAV